MTSGEEVSSLKSIAMKAVRRRYVNVKRVVELVKFFENIDWMIEEGPSLKKASFQFIKMTYPSLKELHGEEKLKEVLDDEVIRAMNAIMSNMAKEKQRFISCTKSGRVVQRASISSSQSVGPVPKPMQLKRSVSGSTAYPYMCLQAGRQWPSDVDPTRREEHLEEDEFRDIFKISYDVYCAYPPWKKLLIKKQKKLF